MTLYEWFMINKDINKSISWYDGFISYKFPTIDIGVVHIFFKVVSGNYNKLPN